MGERFQFVCPQCGYRVDVCGGDECGMRVLLTTIQCDECRKLYDIVLSEEPWDKEPSEEELRAQLRCPRSRKHHVRRWEAGGPCPRCQTPMETDGLSCIWD